MNATTDATTTGPEAASELTQERRDWLEALHTQRDFLKSTTRGITDEQANTRSTVSELTLGGLIKHVTNCQRGWMERVAAAPELTESDKRPMDEQAADYGDEFVMRSDETLAEILAAFDEQNAETIRLIETSDLGAAVPVPPGVPWFPKDIPGWSVRWVALGRFQSALTLWGLDIDSELLFVGDAGTTEASRPSRRRGFEWSSVFTPTPWLTVDADVAYSRARFRDEDPAGDRIPGARGTHGPVF